MPNESFGQITATSGSHPPRVASTGDAVDASAGLPPAAPVSTAPFAFSLGWRPAHATMLECVVPQGRLDLVDAIRVHLSGSRLRAASLQVTLPLSARSLALGLSAQWAYTLTRSTSEVVLTQIRRMLADNDIGILHLHVEDAPRRPTSGELRKSRSLVEALVRECNLDLIAVSGPGPTLAALRGHRAGLGGDHSLQVDLSTDWEEDVVLAVDMACACSDR